MSCDFLRKPPCNSEEIHIWYLLRIREHVHELCLSLNEILPIHPTIENGGDVGKKKKNKNQTHRHQHKSAGTQSTIVCITTKNTLVLCINVCYKCVCVTIYEWRWKAKNDGMRMQVRDSYRLYLCVMSFCIIIIVVVIINGIKNHYDYY